MGLLNGIFYLLVESQLKRLHLDGTCRGLLQTPDDYVNKRREHGTPENTIEIAMHGKYILLSTRR
jgi:hypothetical protein